MELISKDRAFGYMFIQYSTLHSAVPPPDRLLQQPYILQALDLPPERADAHSVSPCQPPPPPRKHET